MMFQIQLKLNMDIIHRISSILSIEIESAEQTLGIYNIS